MVRTETVTKNLLAVIFHGAALGETLRGLLLKERLRVTSLSGPTAALPVWEKPAYIFFFVSEKDDFEAIKEQFWGTVQAVKEAGGKMMLVLENCEERERDLTVDGLAKENFFVVKIKGGIGTNTTRLRDTAKRILTLAFSSGETQRENWELLIVGKNSEMTGAGADSFLGKRKKSINEVMANLSQRRRRWVDRKLAANLIIVVLTVLLLSPFFWLGMATAAGWSFVGRAAEALKQNQIQRAEDSADRAHSYFSSARATLGAVAMIWPVLGGQEFTQRYFNMLSVGERATDAVSRAGVLLPKAQDLIREVVSGSGTKRVSVLAAETSLELDLIDQDLGLIEGQLDDLLTPRLVNMLSFLGLPPQRVKDYREQVAGARTEINQLKDLLAVSEEIIPGEGKRKTYLVVLQNSAELRPTGGFIGSYALVNFDFGKMSGFKIYDVYSADGQLRGQIQPPDEILHYLGQPSWFMRDANWAADWPLTARRLEWFLEKETGVVVDGVVGLDLGAIQKVLGATGPILLGDSQTTVTRENFFEKAEYASEINFFPGSDQKPQFLSQVAQGIFSKLTVEKDLDWIALGQAIQEAVIQKDVLVYFNSAVAQKVMAENDWSGSIVPPGCKGQKNNCFMLVEANFGANKANYFVKRTVRVDTVIDKGGGLLTTVVVGYRNESPNASWPGGIYKNYLRFLVPLGSRPESVDLGDGKTATVSGVLTADVLKGVAADQFLVFQNTEQALTEKTVVGPAFTSFGVYVEIPVGGERVVKFTYRPLYKLDFSRTSQNFRMVFLKQPGTAGDVLDFSLDYPSFLKPVWGGEPLSRDFSILALPQKLVYNTELTKDRVININFKRQ